MASHVINMTIIGNSFGTEEMRQVWDETNRLQKHLDVEKALAEAEAEFRIIPLEAAEAIGRVANQKLYDLEKIAELGKVLKHSLMGTIKTMQNLAGPGGEYVHYGATTQDVVDTGTMLQLKEAHVIIKREVKKLISVLAEKVELYKNTPFTGRTHGVQALPTTFGFKLAVLLAEFGRHLERLNELEKRVFVGVLSGAIGTYASVGQKGPEIEARTMAKLGLGTAEICWHSSRDRLAEYASTLALISGTLGKIGHEFYFLMHTEIGEAEEPITAGAVGSSTMPQKRNPAAFEGIASLTKPIFYSASLVRDAMLMEHERDAMAWRAEWIALPEICIYLSNQLATTIYALNGLVVHEDKMLDNLERTGGLIVAEKVMFELGKFLGKQTAHEVVYEVAMKAQEQNIKFSELLKQDRRVSAHFSAEAIEGMLNPCNYLGEATVKAQEVLNIAKTRGWLV